MAYRSHVALVYNLTGQTVEFYPPTDILLAEGAPTAAATYKVWAGVQLNDDTPKFSGAATLDTVSTVTETTSGANETPRNRVFLASTTGAAIGRRYLITDSAGANRIVVVPRAVLGGIGVDHENDLPIDVAGNSPFVGLRHVFTVDPTFIASPVNINIYGGILGRVLLTDSGDTDTIAPPYRVEWTYITGAGVTRKHWTTFDVTRAPLKHNVTIDHVKASMPDVIWMEWTQQRGQDFQPQICEAFERLKYDIRMAGYDPNMVTDPQVVDRLVTLGARACIATALDKDPDGKIEAAYSRAFEKAIGTGLRAWIAVDGSGATAVKPARQLWLSR